MADNHAHTPALPDRGYLDDPKKSLFWTMLYTILLSVGAIIYVRHSFSIVSNEIEQYRIRPDGDVVTSEMLEQFIYDKLNESCSKKPDMMPITPDNNVNNENIDFRNNTENELKQNAKIQQPKFDLAPIIHTTRLMQMENIGHTEKVWKLKNSIQNQRKFRRLLATSNEKPNLIPKVASVTSEVNIDNGKKKPDDNANDKLLQNNLNIDPNMNGNIKLNEDKDGSINIYDNDNLEDDKFNTDITSKKEFESNNAFTIVTEAIASKNLKHFLTYNGHKCKNISIAIKSAIKDVDKIDHYSFYSQNQLIEVIKLTNHTRMPMLNGQFDVRAKEIIPNNTILGVYCGDMYLQDEFYKVFENSCQFWFRGAYYFSSQAYYNNQTYNLLTDGIVYPSNPLLYINDCRQNIHKAKRTANDFRVQNTQFIQAWIAGFPKIYLVSTKVICKGCSLLTYYGEAYSWSYFDD